LFELHSIATKIRRIKQSLDSGIIKGTISFEKVFAGTMQKIFSAKTIQRFVLHMQKKFPKTFPRKLCDTIVTASAFHF
jgi:hypothetical protein